MRTAFGDVEIKLDPLEGPDAAAREASMRELRVLLSDFRCRVPEARRVVLELYARLRGDLGVSAVRASSFELDAGSPQADAIARALAEAATSGRLLVRRPQMRTVILPLETVDEPVLGPLPETDWIEIELVDQDGKPVPNVDYRIECDDGRVRTGTTGLSGKAREEGLHDGNCKVSFPRLNPPDWSKVA